MVDLPSKKTNQKAEPTPLEQKVAELQAQVNANEVQKQSDLQKAAGVAEEKKQQALQKQEDDLKAAADLGTLLDEVGDKTVDKTRTVDDLTPTEVIGVMTNAIEKSLSARDQLAKVSVDKSIGEVRDSVGEIKKLLGQQAAMNSVTAARAKHSDFDDHKTEILAVMNKYPGIEPEDAYTLAVGEGAKKVPGKKNTETERPQGDPNTQQQKTERAREEHDPSIGLQGFRNIVSDGLERALANLTPPE